MATIPPRPGLEVFVDKNGTITIRQNELVPSLEPTVVVHPDDVPALITMLEDARREARREGAEERDDVTVPEIVHPQGSDS
jgi:hypothetical protein